MWIPWQSTGSADRYTCRTPHFHMYSHCTDHTAQMTCVHGSSLSCVPKIGHSTTRHVSPCASQYSEHQHKFSLTYLSCVTVVFFSEPRPFVHASIYPPWRSTAGWYFYGIPLLHRLRAQEDRAQQDSSQPTNQIIDDQDDIEEIGVKPLSYSQSLEHSAYDSAESIATRPDSDLEDEQLRKMLASPLYIREREENEGQARAYHSRREGLMIHSSRNPEFQGNLVQCFRATVTRVRTRFPKETEVTNRETVSRVVFILFLDLLTR